MQEGGKGFFSGGFTLSSWNIVVGIPYASYCLVSLGIARKSNPDSFWLSYEGSKNKEHVNVLTVVLVEDPELIWFIIITTHS